MGKKSGSGKLLQGLFLAVPFLVILCAGSLLQAQIHGVPASVTSLDSNHTMFNPPGVPASVTSLGPRGFGNGRGCCLNFPTNGNRPFFNGRHRRDHDGDRGFGGAAVAYPVYVPYYYPVDPGPAPDDSADNNYTGGPTIFDRRSSSSSSLGADNRIDERLGRLEEKVEQAESTNDIRASANAPAQLVAAPDQPTTVLVFRDGHSIEVKNYAILGDVLYDYSTGTRRKIELSELDLAATQKQNDDRGVDFRVPGHAPGK